MSSRMFSAAVPLGRSKKLSPADAVPLMAILKPSTTSPLTTLTGVKLVSSSPSLSRASSKPPAPSAVRR